MVFWKVWIASSRYRSRQSATYCITFNYCCKSVTFLSAVSPYSSSLFYISKLICSMTSTLEESSSRSLSICYIASINWSLSSCSYPMISSSLLRTPERTPLRIPLLIPSESWRFYFAVKSCLFSASKNAIFFCKASSSWLEAAPAPCERLLGTYWTTEICYCC